MSTISTPMTIDDREITIFDNKSTQKKVLEEDEYLDRMAKIIRRDFFSDERFSNAANTPDSSYLATDQTSSFSQTPGTSRTQYSTSSAQTRKEACSLGLNDFLDRYTSEDNAYFDKIQRKEMRRHRAKYPWLYKDPSNHDKFVNNQLKLPSLQEQASIGASNDATKMIGWHHDPQNSLFYPTIDKEASKKSKSIINYNSNKYEIGPIFKRPHMPKEVIKPKSYRMKDKIGIDGKLLDGSETPMINGYSFIPPPETPRVVTDESRAKSDTNRFYIPNESPRDELAHRVYEAKVAKNIRTPKTGPGSTPLTKTPSVRKGFSGFSFSPERIKNGRSKSSF